MHGAAVVHGDGAGRRLDVYGVPEVELLDIAGVQAPRPLPLVVVLIEKLSGVAPGQEADRPVREGGVLEQQADGQGTVVGMGIELDVLVPVHLVVSVVPLEIELGVMEHDVGADEIRRHVREHAGGDLPEQRVLLVRPLEAPDARRIRRMARRQIEDGAGAALAPTLLDELVHHGPDASDLAGVEQRLHREVSTGEIILALLLVEDPGGVGQYGFRCHPSDLPIERTIWYIGSISIVPTAKRSGSRGRAASPPRIGAPATVSGRTVPIGTRIDSPAQCSAAPVPRRDAGLRLAHRTLG